MATIRILSEAGRIINLVNSIIQIKGAIYLGVPLGINVDKNLGNDVVIVEKSAIDHMLKARKKTNGKFTLIGEVKGIKPSKLVQKKKRIISLMGNGIEE